MPLLRVHLQVFAEVPLLIEAFATHVAGEASDLLVNRLHMRLQQIRPRGAEVTAVVGACDPSAFVHRLFVIAKTGVIH